MEIKPSKILSYDKVEVYMEQCLKIGYEFLKKVMDHQEIDDPQRFILDYSIA